MAKKVKVEEDISKKLSLKSRLIKESTVKLTSVLNESTIFSERELVTTSVPMINVALSGKLDGGLAPGVLMLAGPSKHFKTGFALFLAGEYLKKYDDGIILFYDSEFGAPQSYFEQFNIDMSRVVHTPIKNLEELKFDIVHQLKNIDKEDHVMIIIDSIGNLASIREVENAENQKNVSDMTRAKEMKSLFRMITPELALKHIPLVPINHVYKEIGLFPKDIVSGGTGSYYSSNDIWILGRRQDKDGKELNGYSYVINVDKSRFVREKTQIFIDISFDSGLFKWSGLFDIALKHGSIEEVTNGWYRIKGTDSKVRKADLLNDDSVWENLLKDESFKQYIEASFKLDGSKLLTDSGETKELENEEI